MPSVRPWLAAGALALGPALAHAHAILIQSQPSAGGTVPAGGVAFDLRYNSRIDAERSRLTLTLPDQTATVLPLQPTASPDRLTSTAKLSPGAYSLRWQVLAIDGHITRGDVAFTVSAPGAKP